MQPVAPEPWFAPAAPPAKLLWRALLCAALTPVTGFLGFFAFATATLTVDPSCMTGLRPPLPAVDYVVAVLVAAGLVGVHLAVAGRAWLRVALVAAAASALPTIALVAYFSVHTRDSSCLF